MTGSYIYIGTPGLVYFISRTKILLEKSDINNFIFNFSPAIIAVIPSILNFIVICVLVTDVSLST